MRSSERPNLILPRRFLRMCRRCIRRPKVADYSGQVLTGGDLLVKTLVLRRFFERAILASDEKNVAILLPPSIGAILVNAALPLSGRVPVNLNYAASIDTVKSCLAQVEARHVVTSRQFLTKTNLSIEADFVFLEDFKKQITWRDKAVALIEAYLVPLFILERVFGLSRTAPDDVLTILFTAGSTGDPKGVMLSHGNIGSNVEAVQESFRIEKTDVLLGVLPFFHAFGFMGALWTVLTLEPKGVFHFTPLDARRIGQLCEEHRVTIILAAPTFLRMYWRRCTTEQLESVNLVVVSAEKMPLDLARRFQDKFGVQPVEAYGSTELSPLAATNIPDDRLLPGAQRAIKEETVGRPVPRTRARIVDPETGMNRGVDQEGMLLIAGPNVMLGYLHRPEATADVIRDGWFVTGDIARIDADGFITITDRASRFSKIGGEIVPHLKVEESLRQVIAADSNDEEDVAIAVTAIPDAERGERLVVLHKPLGLTAETVVRRMSALGIPNLWIPSQNSFLEVPEIPLLGAGKVDLKSVKRLALEKLGAPK
jgi:acyl-[acyl-carrier-protein]-phospholipid O-acyltransferase / long-chain-fatty-acid--[acyl-carrier-protein] ligase